jgi:hypothetical protein
MLTVPKRYPSWEKDRKSASYRDWYRRLGNTQRLESVEFNKKYVNTYLEEHPCVDCGNPDIRVLDFDHVRGVKLGHVKAMAQNRAPLDVLAQEIAKCEIRCSNCHRIRHYEERNS